MAKPKVSVRLDADLINEAKRLDISLPALFTKCLEEVTRTGKCPVCKQKLKGKKDGRR